MDNDAISVDVCPYCRAAYADIDNACPECALNPEKQRAADKAEPIFTRNFFLGLLVSATGLALSVFLSRGPYVVAFYGMVLAGVAIAMKR